MHIKQKPRHSHSHTKTSSHSRVSFPASPLFTSPLYFKFIFNNRHPRWIPITFPNQPSSQLCPFFSPYKKPLPTIAIGPSGLKLKSIKQFPPPRTHERGESRVSEMYIPWGWSWASAFDRYIGMSCRSRRMNWNDVWTLVEAINFRGRSVHQ